MSKTAQVHQSVQSDCISWFRSGTPWMLTIQPLWRFWD